MPRQGKAGGFHTGEAEDRAEADGSGPQRGGEAQQPCGRDGQGEVDSADRVLAHEVGKIARRATAGSALAEDVDQPVGSAEIEKAEKIPGGVAVFDAPRQFNARFVRADDDVPLIDRSAHRQPLRDRVCKRVDQHHRQRRRHEPTHHDISREYIGQLE